MNLTAKKKQLFNLSVMYTLSIYVHLHNKSL